MTIFSGTVSGMVLSRLANVKKKLTDFQLAGLTKEVGGLIISDLTKKSPNAHLWKPRQ
jgi:hypothetical protein